MILHTNSGLFSALDGGLFLGSFGYLEDGSVVKSEGAQRRDFDRNRHSDDLPRRGLWNGSKGRDERGKVRKRDPSTSATLPNNVTLHQVRMQQHYTHQHH